jgi:trk system potassium uptake protein TrkH
MLNYKIISRTIGFLLIGEGLFMLLALLVSAIYSEYDLKAFILSSGITLASGLLFFLLSHKAQKQIGKREGFIIVGFVWIFFSLFGSLPYYLSNAIPNYTDAFFETISGFTTTGASILNNIEEMPHGILFWRSLTQWFGGMGIVVLSLAILPAFGIGGMSLYAAEAPGVTYEKINPRIKETAKILWYIYVAFTILQTVMLILGGMSFFDAICHSFTTLSTGGYSTKQASIAYWDSAYIQYVVAFFMVIAATNFSLLFFLITGKPGKLFKNEEAKFYFAAIILFTIIISSGLLFTTDYGLEKSIRNGFFQVVSILTTTGYATDNYLAWTPFLWGMIMLLFFIGGSTGSTSGGIKTMRIALLIKNSYYEMRRLLHPNAVIPVRFNKKSINQQVITNVLAFFFLYVTIFFLSSLLFMLFVDDFETAVGAVASALGNIGPGFGSVGPADSFAHLPAIAKWFLSFLMLLGRLELFTILVLFSPAFWRK